MQFLKVYGYINNYIIENIIIELKKISETVSCGYGYMLYFTVDSSKYHLFRTVKTARKLLVNLSVVCVILTVESSFGGKAMLVRTYITFYQLAGFHLFSIYRIKRNTLENIERTNGGQTHGKEIV